MENDWADEIAETIEFDTPRWEIAKALRAAELRGRASGLKIAKEIVEKADFQDDIFHEICNIINKLKEESA